MHFAAQGVIAGTYDIAVAAGVESTSRIRMGVNRMDMDTSGPTVTGRYAPGLVSQGIAAELVAARWKLSREQLDALSAESHRRADTCRTAGQFAREIVPITTPDGSVVSADESIRPGTSAEKLGGLKPAFEDATLLERFPQINWSITAGNSSQITDGASALLIMSAEKAEELMKDSVRYPGGAHARADLATASLLVALERMTPPAALAPTANDDRDRVSQTSRACRSLVSPGLRSGAQGRPTVEGAARLLHQTEETF